VVPPDGLLARAGLRWSSGYGADIATVAAESPDIRLRRRRLRTARRRATALLVAVSALFVALTLAGATHGGWGYHQAAAEASMVGGAADWFAVTALFRHPLGLPIPHTAVIVERKDQFGETLGQFVQEHFLNGEVVADRIRRAGLARRLAGWLSDPVNADRLSEQGARLVVQGGHLVRGETRAALAAQLRAGLERAPLARWLGRAVELLTADGRDDALLDAALGAASRFLDTHDDSLRDRFHAESPRWVPAAVDDAVFDQLLRRARLRMEEVLADPDHEYRRSFRAWLQRLASDLQQSEEAGRRVDALRHRLLDDEALRRWSESLWNRLEQVLAEQAPEPGSELRRQLASLAMAAGRRMESDPDLRASLERGAESAVRWFTDQFHEEIAGLVAGTIARWDARDTADRLELLLGRDLQFIRINGTAVGAVVGVAIHAVALALG
jgi:uncharacterized membrane-anchored protein YjiN (DUF445 family)